MNILYVIPARGGSKGIPRKNIKLLGGKPLIYFSIEVARALAKDEDICVSTDDEEIKAAVQQIGLSVPFLRPGELSTDTTATYDVLLHALKYIMACMIFYSRSIPAIIHLRIERKLRKCDPCCRTGN